jgi:CHAT domain-containing protein
MEIIKEADMQDFFLGKCAINTIKPLDWKTTPLQDAAIVYPILLPDRIELVIKTDQEIFRRTINVPAVAVKEQIKLFGQALEYGKPFRKSAEKLYEWLLKPVQSQLETDQIKTLVYVPDRDMRTVPFAAFNDGKHFVVEEFGVVTMPSLAFQNLQHLREVSTTSQELFAGLSVADGPSIDKLPKKVVSEITNSEFPGKNRSVNVNSTQRGILAENLSLPSVEKEIDVLSAQQASKILMNSQFTTSSFKSHLESGDFEKVHIASHGFFGNNAKDSFILAYDEILSLEDLQTSLSANKLQVNPISLLTLSACETAQGNDRMLLGFSGMAIKSNVQSALGSLWPIDDEGAMEFMTLFYQGINKSMAKARALQEAQVAMIKSTKFKHPYYWSPFILTGNWR